jgi:hypothetical protein
MTKRFGLLLASYLVPTFALGFVWHLVLFDAYYHDLGIYRDAVIIPFGFGSMLLQGSIFAAALPRSGNAGGSAPSVVKFVIGGAVLSWSFTTLAVAAKHQMTSVPGFMLIETGYTVVQFLLVGPLWALVARADS